MSNLFSRTIPWVLIMLLGTILTVGCAAKKLVVNNADTFVEYQIEKRLPLDTRQKDVLAKDVDTFLNKHKDSGRVLLPILASLDLNNPDKIAPQYQQFVDVYEKVVRDFSQILAKHMAGLGPNQQKEFFAELDEENKQMEKRDADNRKQRARERFINFFGSINGQQEELFKKYAPELEERYRQRLERRKILHASFRETYAQEAEESKREKRFLRAYEEFNAYRPHAKNLEVIKALIPTLAPEQIKHFLGKVDEVKEMLNYYIQAEY